MNRFKAVIDGVKSGWNKIDTKKRNGMLVVLTIMIIFASIFTHFTSKINYVTLFNNLEFEDSGNIVNDLETKKINYKIENQGRKILIDEKFVDKYRLQLAMEGKMPENSSGFEIFDNMGLMVTDEDRKIMYQRALSGELQRSIMSLDPVNSAKVILVMSEKSIFETKAKEASASVIIDLKPSMQVTNNMIKGIAALISGAVENLPEENIQIIDSKGNLLSGILQENQNIGTIDIVSQHQKIKDEFEEKIEFNLKELLGSAFGRDKIRVSVYADLDFDSEETTLIKYDNPVARSEQISASGSNVNVQEVTGGNIGDNISNVVDSVSGEGSTYNRIVNNELSTETKTTIKAPGKVNKLTTSVIYDGILSEEDSTKIINIVATATGFDIERGDHINVEGIKFDRTYEKQLQAELDAIKFGEENNFSFFENYKEYLIVGLFGALGLIILISLLKALFTKKNKDKNPKLDVGMYGAVETINKTIDEIEEKLEIKVDSNKLKVQEYAKENPDIAADLIKAWMKN